MEIYTEKSSSFNKRAATRRAAKKVIKKNSIVRIVTIPDPEVTQEAVFVTQAEIKREVTRKLNRISLESTEAIPGDIIITTQKGWYVGKNNKTYFRTQTGGLIFGHTAPFIFCHNDAKVPVKGIEVLLRQKVGPYAAFHSLTRIAIKDNPTPIIEIISNGTQKETPWIQEPVEKVLRLLLRRRKKLQF